MRNRFQLSLFSVIQPMCHFANLRIIFYLEIVLSLADWLCEASQGGLFPVKAKTYGVRANLHVKGSCSLFWNWNYTNVPYSGYFLKHIEFKGSFFVSLLHPIYDS